MCVWRNFLRESAILLSRKKRANVFMKLFFLPSPPSLFFLPATEAEKKTSQTHTTKTKEYYGLLCASVTRSFAQRCNYYTGYNSKLTSFLSVLVLSEK